ncbi:MAG TPA: hypothetical protein PLP33_25430, partial [Leptospiraceae bacterium]|nr:hypothetical protein [Leptospiraceae bacterium]
DYRKGATPETLDVIRRHLQLVFAHEIDPINAQTVPSSIADSIHGVKVGDKVTLPDGSTVVAKC